MCCEQTLERIGQEHGRAAASEREVDGVGETLNARLRADHGGAPVVGEDEHGGEACHAPKVVPHTCALRKEATDGGMLRLDERRLEFVKLDVRLSDQMVHGALAVARGGPCAHGHDERSGEPKLAVGRKLRHLTLQRHQRAGLGELAALVEELVEHLPAVYRDDDDLLASLCRDAFQDGVVVRHVADARLRLGRVAPRLGVSIRRGVKAAPDVQRDHLFAALGGVAILWRREVNDDPDLIPRFGDLAARVRVEGTRRKPRVARRRSL